MKCLFLQTSLLLMVQMDRHILHIFHYIDDVEPNGLNEKKKSNRFLKIFPKLKSYKYSFYTNVKEHMRFPLSFFKAALKKRSKSLTIARFIWNTEISVTIAIHCYERLF